MKQPDRQRESPHGVHFYQKYLECPRSWYLRYGLGLTSEKTGKALIFGGVFHQALEHYYLSPLYGFDGHRLIDETIDFLTCGLQDRMDEYENEDDYFDDLDKAETMLREWHQTWYETDLHNYDILEVETQHEFNLGPNGEFLFTVRPDRVVRDKHNKVIYVIDTKTTGWSVGGTYKSVELQDQMTAYLWAVAKDYQKETVSNAIVDIIYKRGSKCEAARPAPIYHTQWHLNMFEMNLFGLIMEVSQKYQNLGSDFPAEILFPRNGSHCAKFGCEFEPICRNKVGYEVPYGFIRDEWTDEMAVLKKIKGMETFYEKR